MGLACVAGVKRGRGRDNLDARKRARQKGRRREKRPSRAVSRPQFLSPSLSLSNACHVGMRIMWHFVTNQHVLHIIPRTSQFSMLSVELGLAYWDSRNLKDFYSIVVDTFLAKRKKTTFILSSLVRSLRAKLLLDGNPPPPFTSVW